MKELTIWLPGLTLHDSNYGNFRTGQEARFALQLNPLSLAPAEAGTPALEPLEAGRYQFFGPVVYRHGWEETARRAGGADRVFNCSFSVLDLGLRVGCWDHSHLRLPMAADPGSWWAGELFLRLDETTPRFESLPGIPAHVYQWRVERILLDETPLTSLTTQKGRRYVGKDMTQESYREVAATDYWTFDHSDYLLDCTCLAGPWPSRFPPVSPEERLVASALEGAAVALVVPGAVETGAERAPWTALATVLQVSPDEPRSQKVLLRLDLPLTYEGSAYQHAVAYLRYDGEGLSRLVTHGQLFCSVKGLPADRVMSTTPFDHHKWPAGAPLAAEIRRT